MTRTLGPSLTPSGMWKALILVVKFSDKAQSVTPDYFDSLIFGNATGTMRDFYSKVSYNNLDIVTVNMPSSVGWMTMPQTYSYYVSGQNGFGSYPQNAQRLVEDALAAADSSVDYSQYDNDNDGYVDALFVVHTGPGAEFTGSNNDIWSHAWTTSTPQFRDGVNIFRYSMEPEYWAAPGDMTCGVFAHELGHAGFGLPDLYDVDYSSSGLGRWSLMAGGSWNGAGGLGESPAFPDAWSHYQMGYIAPENIITNSINRPIQNIENVPVALRLWTNGTLGSQYFLIENRQQVGYDTYLPGNGLLVYHIDESIASDNQNEWYPGHTSSGHYLVALEQADGLYELDKGINSGNAADPFPGTTNNSFFSNTTLPNSNDYSNADTKVRVQSISNSGATMYADVSVGLVFGKPEIVVREDTLHFGLAGIGSSKTDTLIIDNYGSDSLIVSNITSNNPSYVPAVTSFLLSAGSTKKIPVTFTPIDTMMYYGALTITSNDTSHPVVNVAMIGAGVYAPVITISPDSFMVMLGEGDSVIQTMTIGNSGQGTLYWNGDGAAATAFLNPSRDRRNDRIRPISDVRYMEKISDRAIKRSMISGAATLTGDFYDNFEDGDLEGWNINGAAGVREITSSTSAIGTKSFHYQNSTLGHSHGISRDFLSEYQPEYAGFYVRTSTNFKAGGYFRIDTDESLMNIIWFFADPTGKFYVNDDVSGDNTFVYNALQWYHVEFRNIDWTNKNFDYYVDNQLIKADIPFRNAAIANRAARLFLYNFDSTEAWWDAITVGKRSDWISVSPVSGIVEPGATQEVAVKFSAGELPGGDYHSVIAIGSNDPSNNPKIVPASMHITGKPVIAFTPDSMNSGIVFIGGNKVDTLTVRNAGSEPLMINSITTNNAAFVAEPTGFTLSAGAKQQVLITFTPSDTVVYTGMLTVESNDSTRPTVEIPLSGRGAYAPIITVVPDSLFVALGQGDSAVTIMTIGNIGQGPLNWNTGFGPAVAPLAVDQTQWKHAPAVVQQFRSSTYPKKNSKKLPIRTNNFSSISYGFPLYAAKANGIYKIDPNNGTMQLFFPMALSGGPDGVAYDGNYVYVINGFGLNKIIRIDASLTTIVDTIDVNFSGSIDGLATDGRYVYALDYTYDKLYAVDIQTQSISAVLNLSAQGIGGGVTFASRRNSIFVANFDLQILEIDRSNGSVIHMIPSIGINVVGLGYSNSANVLLATNGEFVYVLNPDNGEILNTFAGSYWGLAADEANGAFISISPVAGIVAPGSTQDVEVRFNATDLPGGDYPSVISIKSNDPVNNPKNIPAAMHVIGKPVIAVHPDSLLLGTVFVGMQKTDTVLVKNIGSEPLMINSITSDNAAFVPEPTSFTLSAGALQPVVVTFTPTDSISYIGNLTITSNDSSRLSTGVSLAGRGIYAPVITVSPDSLFATLGQGDSTIQLMTIGNTGQGTLNWSINGFVSGSGTSPYRPKPLTVKPVSQKRQVSTKVRKISPLASGTYSGALQFGITNFGEIMPFQFPVGTEHLQHGTYASGYTLAYTILGTNVIAYAGYDQRNYLLPVSYTETVNTGTEKLIEVLMRTLDNALEIKRTFGYRVTDQFITITTQISNIGPNSATNIVFKEWTDWDMNGSFDNEWGFDSLRTMLYAKEIQYATIISAQTPNKIDMNGWDDIYRWETNEDVPPGTVNSYDGLALLHFSLADIASNTSQTINTVYASAQSLSELQSVVDQAVSHHWITFAPISGIVPPGGSQIVDVKFSAVNLRSGDYRSSVAINSNDPVNNPKKLDAKLHVIGKPVIVVSPDSVNAGTVFTGSSRVDTVIIRNTGSDVLNVTSITSSIAEFTVAPVNFTVAAGSWQYVVVTFTPSDSIEFNGTITIVSNDSLRSNVEIPVIGRGIYPPVMTVFPDSLSASIAESDSTIQLLTIGNTGFGDLHWTVSPNYSSVASTVLTSPVFRSKSVAAMKKNAPFKRIRPSSSSLYSFPNVSTNTGLRSNRNTASSQAPLANILTKLNENYSNVSNIIPNRYDFEEGISGTSISDGGNDMYDGGNSLFTSLGGALTYSDNAISTSSYLGATGAYFTRKFNGLFVFVADIQGVNYFEINGNLGADGSGSADGAVLETELYGIHYRGFVKRVFNAGDPSINHLVIVADDPTATHEFSTNTNDDYHRVTQLQNSTRIYYLLYAGSSGYYIDNAATLAIMNEFLNSMDLIPEWLRVAPVSGTVTAGSTQDVSVKFNAIGMRGGDYAAALSVTSNDPVSSQKNVPVKLHVTGRPVIHVSPDSIHFGNVFVGMPQTDTVMFKNTGSDPLIVSSIVSSNAAYTMNITGFTIPIGEQQPIVVTFNPTDSVEYSGALSITSNDTVRGIVTIALTGRGIYPPVMTVDPDSFIVSLKEGDSTLQTLSIGNSGNGVLEFSTGIHQSAIKGKLPNTVSAKDIAMLKKSSSALSGQLFPEQNRNRHRSNDEQVVMHSTSIGGVLKDITLPASGWTGMTSVSSTLYALNYNNGMLYQVNPDDGTLLTSVYLSFQPYSLAFDGQYFWISNTSNNIVAYNSSGTMIKSFTTSIPSYKALAWDGEYFWYCPAFLQNPTIYKSDASGNVVASYNAGIGQQISSMVWAAGSLWVIDVQTKVVKQLNLSSGTVVVENTFTAPNMEYVYAMAHNGSDLLTLDWAGHLYYLDDGNAGGTWLSVNPVSGTVNPGGTALLDVQLNALKLMAGEYRSVISVSSNDPLNSPKNVQVNLSVTPGDRPAIVLSDDSLRVAMVGDASETVSFYIKNAGTQPLNFSLSDTTLMMIMKQYSNEDGSAATGKMKDAANVRIKKIGIQRPEVPTNTRAVHSRTFGTAGARLIERELDGGMILQKRNPNHSPANVSWLSEDPINGSVAPGDSVKINVTFDGAGLAAGLYHAMIRVASNDPFRSVVTVNASLTKLLNNFTTDDNDNNAFAGVPDFDMDTYLYNDDVTAPIEFNIFVDEDSIHTVQLNMLVWDVDWAGGERDSVVFNGHFVGYLTGADGEWSTSIFRIDPAWVVPGPNGKNRVQVYIDILNLHNWAVSVDWGQLVINGSAGMAFFRYVNTDNTIYAPGDSILVTEEVDTDSLPMAVRVETDIVDPSDNIILGTNRMITVTTGNEPFTEQFMLPGGLAYGVYRVLTIVYDAVTDLQQDLRYTEFTIALPTPTNVFAGTGFDAMVPLTWDLESNFEVSPRPLIDIRIGDDAEQIAVAKRRLVKKLKDEMTKLPFRTKHDAAMSTVNLQYFNIFRGTKSGGPYAFLTSVSMTGRTYFDHGDYIDTSVVNGQTYYYVLTAVYENGESDSSAEVTASPVAEGQMYHSTFTTTVPVLDGNVVAGEWDDAASFEIQLPGHPQPVIAKFKNSATTLYLAIDDIHNTTTADFNEVGFYFDSDNNDTWDTDTLTREGNFWINFINDSTWTVFRGIFGNYPQVGFAGTRTNPAGVKAHASILSGHVQYEISFDRGSEYFQTAGDSIGLWLFTHDDSAKANFYYHFNGSMPLGSIWSAPKTYGTLVLGNILGAEENNTEALPKSFALSQNYPNPFNPSTTILYDLPKDANVTLKIYNVLGEEVATIVNDNKSAGYHSVVWNGRTNKGIAAASGIYFYHLSAGDFKRTLKMILLK